jgi:hypothetical protein
MEKDNLNNYMWDSKVVSVMRDVREIEEVERN